MNLSIHNLLMAFIPLFVAIDIIGALPIFISLTYDMDAQAKKRLVVEATLTAGAVALVFLVLGQLIFSFLGITENDFRIGGGIVLLVLSVYDLLFAKDTQRDPGTSVGVVPIGIPLIMGPAALTSIIIVVDNYGYWISVISLLANLFVVWMVFHFSEFVMKVMGVPGSRAVGKVSSLFMAAIAVMMIRVGIQNILR
ncbi:MAG TPA: MarC family protein [Bacteroidota bacterium]|nr:MarC family protein [Bacteroidota bacterium]